LVHFAVVPSPLSVFVAAERKSGPARNEERFRMPFWWSDGRSIMQPASLVERGIGASGRAGISQQYASDRRILGKVLEV